jgi:hypothetical protein
MANQLFIEDLMERIRSLVRTEAQGATPTTSSRVLSRNEISATDLVNFRLHQHQPAARSGAQRLRSFQDLTESRAELQSCLAALERIGEVNPRPPGFMNDRIQSAKRFLRRTLIWYMRPLRMFYRAVIRTLEQLLAALEKQQEMLGDCALQTDLLAAEGRLDDMEQGTCQIYELTQFAIETGKAQFQVTRDELEALRQDLHVLRAEVASSRQQLNEVTARYRSLEQSSPKRSAGKMDFLHASTKRPDQS